MIYRIKLSKVYLILSMVVLFLSLERYGANAQNYRTNTKVDSLSESSLVPKEVLSEKDLFDFALPNVTVEATRYKKLTPIEREKYWRRIRDVKKVLPMARFISRTLKETYEYIDTLPTEKQKKQHLERVEKDLINEYKPLMNIYTLRQGHLLIKLVDRETGSSGYTLIESIYGTFAASWYNMIARMYGKSLKTKYEPLTDEDDAVTERVIYLIEQGKL